MRYTDPGASTAHPAATSVGTTPVTIDPRQGSRVFPAIDRGHDEDTRSSVPTRGSAVPVSTRFQDPPMPLAGVDPLGRIHFNPIPTQFMALPPPATTMNPFDIGLRATGSDVTRRENVVPAEQPEQWPLLLTRTSIAPGTSTVVEDISVSTGAPTGNVDSIDLRLQRDAYRRTQNKFARLRLPPTAMDAEASVNALQIGLLGELYVFELLSSFELPNFTIDNWTSELRGLADLPPFTGIEYADFRYPDHTGQLMRRLLPHEPEVQNATPEVFIEVKATSGGQDDIFHMSPQQFYRAAEMWRGRNPGSPPTQLYMLFRLSNVGNSGQPVIQVYMDVHDLLVRGVLRIESPSVEVRIHGQGDRAIAM